MEEGGTQKEEEEKEEKRKKKWGGKEILLEGQGSGPGQFGSVLKPDTHHTTCNCHATKTGKVVIVTSQ